MLKLVIQRSSLSLVIITFLQVEEVFVAILHGDRKKEFITAIIELDEEDQETLSHFIQKLLTVQEKYHDLGSDRQTS